MNAMDIVQSLEGEKRTKRREIIVGQLETMDVTYKANNFGFGQNIIVSSGKEYKIGIGCHYDAVPGSPGANDNASSVAATLSLIERFEKEPTKNIGIRYFFFDMEESGLIGSHTYLLTHKINKLIGLYNMEMVGDGNRLALWQLKDQTTSYLASSLESVAQEMGIGIGRFDNIANIADSEPFVMAGGMKEAFTITAINDEDLPYVDEYYQAYEKGASFLELSELLLKVPMMRHYHKSSDKSEYLREESLQMTTDAVFNAVKRLDDQWKIPGFQEKVMANRRRTLSKQKT